VGGRPLDATASAPGADPEPEEELIERARRGDAGAYEELVRRHQDLAYRVAYTIVGGAAEAEDAAQEGFFKAWAALGRFRRGAPFRPWVLRIVANEARNRRTAARRRPTVPLDADERRPSGDPARSPEGLALAAERDRVLLAALDSLREDDRLVIACRYFLELSEAETADALGCARGTVKSRLSRALGRLRAQPDLAGLRWGTDEAAEAEPPPSPNPSATAAPTATTPPSAQGAPTDG
jgi:RNA polymerase sigma-70 factor (ECF subfamily)